MKQFFFKTTSVFLAVLLFFAQTQGLSARSFEMGLPDVDETVFELDETTLNSAMSQLNELEEYLLQHEGTTYNDLALANSDLIINLSDAAAPMGMDQSGEAPLGIPAFFWGCVLGWVGLLVVYIVTDNDKPQVKKAFTGCLVSTAVSIVVYVVAYSSI